MHDTPSPDHIARGVLAVCQRADETGETTVELPKADMRRLAQEFLSAETCLTALGRAFGVEHRRA